MNQSPLWKTEVVVTALIGVLVLVAAGAGVFVPGFYQSTVDPEFLTGTITADLVALLCVPLLGVCILGDRRGKLAARMIWVSLLVYLGYTSAVYAFDRMYTVLFPAYIILFSLCSFTVAILVSRLDVAQVASRLEKLRWRRVTAGFLVFTGLILYVIELPIILGRIPDGIQAGGTPFMVLDMALVAPISILTGVWLWQRRPWGAALTGIFLVKAVTLMTSFLIADYMNWFAGQLPDYGPTLAFTFVNVCAYYFVWNYFAAFKAVSK